MKKAFCLLLFCVSFLISKAQTTDLSIVVAAQDLTGSPISQVNIYGEFQYIVTIFNSGNAVNNATFSQAINPSITVQSFISQNQTGGASAVSPINLTGNTLEGTIANLPSNSSVQVKIIVRASLSPGGVATTVTVFPPDGTTDNDTSNNTSVISIDVVEIPIDFTVVYNQINPISGTSITAWNQTITYQFTITNNSAFTFPLQGFRSRFSNLLSTVFGVPLIQLNSLTCVSTTNGIICPDTSGIGGVPVGISSSQNLFNFSSPIEFSAGGSITFEMEVLFLEPACSTQLQPLELSSLIQLSLSPSNINQSSDDSNSISNILLEGNLCAQADLCISTVQTNPNPLQEVNWNEQVTFVTDICNMGPEDAYMRFFLQNLTVGVNWQIVSISCDATTGPITCSDFTLTDQGQFWESNEFVLPANTTITVTTVVIYLESDDCTTVIQDNTLAHARSGVNLLESTLIDPDLTNDNDSDFVLLPPLPECQPEDIVQLSVTKTQINPALPAGSNTSNTISWGEVTYEITATNYSDIDSVTELVDFVSITTPGALVSVTCIATTGTATCYDIVNANIGMLQDGVPDAGEFDVFWQITPEENWTLPAQSSITYQVVIDWQPNCDINAIRARNSVEINSISDPNEVNLGDNTDSVDTFFAPCVDILVQTYPEFTSVGVNDTFNWIVDITNSNTSSNAINIDFENVLGPQFAIAGTPICNVVSGTASCMSSFNIDNATNTISETILNMDAASTIQIVIPVTAPSFGGAFTNTAQAVPNSNDNEELTPDTNISISNVQVIAPTVEKSFSPNQIIVGQQSILEFTIYNLAGNPEQTNINFTDNLPTGVTVAGPISWVNANGCTAIFTSTIGGTTIGVTDLTIPNGVESCTFSVNVTSSVVGDYLNNTTNFTDQNNIDSSQASATLEVLEDTSNVDIEVLKSVTPTEVSIGDVVTFTITATNIGTTEATNISILESLPTGYQYISQATSYGTYDTLTSLWSLPNLLPNQSETLDVIAQVISSNNLLNVASLNSVSEVDRDDTNNEDYAEVTVDGCLQIPSGFSPDNDAVNDTFVIPCIEDYPENILKIYNRYGTLVYLSNNYINDWNGIPNQGPVNQNKVLPVGTYYYVLTINSIKQPFVGYVYLNY
ncbi:gliding motility-associated C-terminal domain-containing protein [Olleya sp. YS]|uniref:DUF7933 domain-containing protein n=1 Tax=Olleya sp. YS TaxID=3028318 RepID=UPI0024342F56|nr:gliding motility-associated C-terminal domain-containing protein [Olleya sp. YS]WGD35896.1 gliding motility-associated C-terminal domain-containing protein [Olleya sp. YS]